MRLAVLDLETKKLFSDPGKPKHAELGISVGGWYEYDTDCYTAFEEPDMHKLEARMKEADLIIGFNIISFDMPVLAPYLLAPVEAYPVFDIMDEIKKVLGHRVSLQSVALASLQEGKSGKGTDAVKLFLEGRMDELKKYCLDDVRITKNVFDYGREHSKLFFKSDFDFQAHEIPLDWSDLSSFVKPKGSSGQQQGLLF